jgi:glycosyltransferase involved in cell wall biosynthesis
MRIAVTAILPQKEHPEGYGRFAKEVFSRLVHSHPEHEFIFLFDRPYDPVFISGTNVTPLVIPFQARHPLLFTYWYDIKAPLALKPHKPDVWVQPYGSCSLTSSIPQLMMVHDLSFLHYPDYFSWHERLYHRLFARRFLRKATSVVTASDHLKQEIAKRYKLSSENIGVVYGAAGQQFKPISWHERQQVKEEYTGGTEYFLCSDDVHTRKNLVNLLRAFSLFKKWQHSNMKLVLTGSSAFQDKGIEEKIRTYKYRNDVIHTSCLTDEELGKLTAAAYASVYPSFFADFGTPVAEAMQSGVPVITGDTGSMHEIGGEAALYAAPDDPDAIAKHMLSLYRDETFRSRMIDAGMTQAARFNWDAVAENVWNNIENCK